jgi:hypothetical protein
MHAMCVVIVSEFSQLPGEVGDVPEEHAVEKLTPNRPDQPFDERMRDRRVRNRLDLLDLEYAQVGEPTVEAEEWVVIGAEVLRQV